MNPLPRHRTDPAEGTADVLDAVDEHLARLRDLRDSEALLRRLCRDAVEIFAFTRVMLSRIDDDAWRPWTVSFTVNPDFDRQFATHLRGRRIPFAESPAEDRARRDGVPVVADPAGGALTPAPLVGLTGAYVVVPLAGPAGVFGLVHADRHPAPRPGDLTTIDRDALWLLAEGFGLLYERAVLGERLEAQRRRLREALGDLEAGAANVVNADLGLERDPPARDGATTPPRESVLAAAGLTPRERDVAELVAKGYGNAAIARELVIVEGTVKTYVKAVMRKLGAATRAEAIAIAHGHPTRR